MRDHPVRPAVLAGEPVAGAMVFEFFTPGTAALLHRSGCRFAIDDTEHTGLSFETMKWLHATQIVTPHALCWTDECFDAIAREGLGCVAAFARGEWPASVVNPQAWDRAG